MSDRITVPGRDPQATVEISRGAHLPVQGFTLQVTAGPDAGLSYTPTGELTVIGTHESAGLKLSDPTVSRFHAELRATDGAVYVKDLGSLNGVFVDGVRVLEGCLHTRASVVVGNTTVFFELGGEPVKVPVSSRDRFGIMVGRSMAMRRAFSLLERAAASGATVLLGGETGTGKEAAAESIHRESSRKDGPFVVVDCGAIPANLLESELFGHEKGAFTGAVAARAGAFEEADGGTIFLDEIGELEPELQPKLLRVLEKREIKRVGTSKYSPVDVRIIAATNKNLRAEVNTKNFRSDLYYRLAVVEVPLPPLRERTMDLPMLVENLLSRLGVTGPEAKLIRTPELQAAMARHPWPGNVRELRNYVERCLALSEQAPFDGQGHEEEEGETAASHGGLPMAVDTSIPLKIARDRWTLLFEKAYLQKTLEETGGNVAAAARAAGIDRIHFYRLLRRSGLR
jgi:transcriptional regulator with GAF, ATPase, and Fis domain